MIPKPGKNPTDVSSYRPTSLLTTISKVVEKLILRKINKELTAKNWIPNNQFWFRQAHSTVQKCHCITDVINNAMENQQYCIAAFLDVIQAFDKVRHSMLLLKVKRSLSTSYFNLLKSYLKERQIETNFKAETSSRFHIHSGVPQVSILGPLLCKLYTSELSSSKENNIMHIRGQHNNICNSWRHHDSLT
jgi:retron-type reverse transcriptase